LKKSRFSEAKIVGILKELEAGTPATELARKMVCEWGMSEKLGPLAFGKKEQEIFLGREISQHRDYSESTAIDIDKEVRRFIIENYERAKNLILANMEALKALAEALLEKESLDAPEIAEIIKRTIGAGVTVPTPLPAV